MPSTLGGVELDVIDVTSLRAHAPTGEPSHHLLVGDVDQQNSGKPPTRVGERLAECVGLGGITRKAVEQEAFAGVLLTDALADHPEDHLVWYQLTGRHVLLRLQPQLAALGDLGAQHVTGGDVS